MTALLSLVVLTWAAPTSPSRYELGERLRRFEVAWESSDAAGRRRAGPILKSSVVSFFANNYPAAGQALDRARHALMQADAPADAIAWADGLRIVPESRFVDAGETSLAWTVTEFYSAGQAPERPRVHLVLTDGARSLTTVERPLETLPLTLKLPLAGAGDRQVQIDVRSGDQVLSRRTVGVSAAQRRDQRLQALPAEWPAELPPLERATLTHLTTLLRGLAAGDAPETDYPANRLLAEVESTLNGERYDARRPGTHWLAVPVGERRVVTRVQVPKGLANGPKALVVALHGAGGSENMFFDAYGVGIVARESARRDWMMIAPRDDNVFQPPPLPGLIDALVDRYPIDAKRVLLVGHSMGAARAVAAARTHPQRFAAVAALGGGGNARGAKALQDRPFLIGYGREDFLKRSALLLVNDLRLAKADLRVIEYPDVEHLSVVAAAADDLFRFFDALAR